MDDTKLKLDEISQMLQMLLQIATQDMQGDAAEGEQQMPMASPAQAPAPQQAPILSRMGQ